MLWNFSRNLRLPARWFQFYVEKRYSFEASFAEAPDGTCLRGYFQSELYFEDIKSEILEIFTPREEGLISAIDIELAKSRQGGENLVAVHIRRGDFLELQDRDCLTSDQFLENAMGGFPDAKFIVFSDDIEWCRTKFAGRKDVCFSPFTRVIEDFFAMARCDHNILAKSTFSWWAAWLNQSPGQKVVAPRIKQDLTWAGAGPDYYPKRWTILG